MAEFLQIYRHENLGRYQFDHGPTYSNAPSVSLSDTLPFLRLRCRFLFQQAEWLEVSFYIPIPLFFYTLI